MCNFVLLIDRPSCRHLSLNYLTLANSHTAISAIYTKHSSCNPRLSNCLAIFNFAICSAVCDFCLICREYILSITIYVSVWLICIEYGGLQQIKTVIKIVCKPTISINLKNQTGVVDSLSRNLSNAWMTQKNKSGNIRKHLTAQQFNSQLLEPHFLHKFD